MKVIVQALGKGPVLFYMEMEEKRSFVIQR